MLYFVCPSCQANCETTPAFAGKAVHCPHCGKLMTVPIDPTAVTTTPPPPKPKPAPASSGATTPNAAPPAATSIAQPGGGTGTRNFVLLLVGVAVLIFLGIWLIPGDTGSASTGTIKIELEQDKAPITTANFLKYVDAKHYDGTIFHRVIKDFMIQGGGFEPSMRQKDSKFPPIRNEARNGLVNKRGTVAMARTGDPNSATDQFFINVEDNSRKLGPGGVDEFGYAVFGNVIEGMDVVDKIRAVEVKSRGGHESVPVKDVMIKSIRRIESSGKNPVVVIDTSKG